MQLFVCGGYRYAGARDTFRSNWRSFALPLILTAILIGSALGLAFS